MNKRCQAYVMFRPDPWNPMYGAGDIKDRSRCPNKSTVKVEGICLCGIHSFDEENTRRALINAWDK